MVRARCRSQRLGRLRPREPRHPFAVRRRKRGRRGVVRGFLHSRPLLTSGRKHRGARRRISRSPLCNRANRLPLGPGCAWGLGLRGSRHSDSDCPWLTSDNDPLTSDRDYEPRSRARAFNVD